MSEQAESWAVRKAGALAMPDPCIRRQVLMALAAKHDGGPFSIPTQTLAAHLQLGYFQIWTVMMELRKRDLLEAKNIGGLMSVTLALDSPDETDFKTTTAPCFALPQHEAEFFGEIDE